MPSFFWFWAEVGRPLGDVALFLATSSAQILFLAELARIGWTTFGYSASARWAQGMSPPIGIPTAWPPTRHSDRCSNEWVSPQARHSNDDSRRSIDNGDSRRPCARRRKPRRKLYNLIRAHSGWRNYGHCGRRPKRIRDFCTCACWWRHESTIGGRRRFIQHARRHQGRPSRADKFHVQDRFQYRNFRCDNGP